MKQHNNKILTSSNPENSNSDNVPLIRFLEFKDAWEHKQLNELLSEAKKRNVDLKYGKDEVLSVSGELGIVNQIEHLGRSYAGVSVHQYHVDLYDKVKSNHQKEKVSILEDVDFELELIDRDEINENYIIQLLIKLKASVQKDVTKTEKEIFNLLNSDAQLRSKRELIEKFIQENLPVLEDTDDIPEAFNKFWNEEQQKAFNQ